ncbi:RILP-like protein homolog isoform X3 [Agrilus planipennis]|uniref:RILP-like protein homolog isoform X3 n=1 Tax=Agrilus planipennis TaxID=224129 RepID=A0A7F5RNQ2_AGRPL|nr:RILP-like protein homolog isoform X3 [Agrilus planipennis]
MPRLYYSPRKTKMDDVEDPAGDVTVVDVYDIASDIGKECEKIIDTFGADAVTSLMPKVINALELLENLAIKNERENTLILDMKSKITQLENDKIEKAEYRQKFERELETIEDQWRTESKDLVMLVSKLQEENRKLKSQDNSQFNDINTIEQTMASDMLGKLQASIDKQREEIRQKERQLEEKNAEVENFKTQIEKITTSTRDLRRRHKTLQNQVRTLCDERADFLVQLQDQQRDITALRQRLGIAVKENEDLAKCDITYPSNKAVFDLDDPNRPRFTTQELKDILHERNELKARVSDLEEELDTYRPKPKVETKKHVPINKGVEVVPEIVINNAEEPVDEEAPVQGPLPYEPDDAPWKKSESGIRKFFRKIFSETNPGGSFPRRSLSTLTKMALSSTSEPTPV